jgi:WW domain
MFSGTGTEKKESKAEKDAVRKKLATITLQCFVRKAMAKIRVRKRALRIWRKVFDPSSKLYFWYNQFNGQSQWTLPRYMEWYTEHDISSTGLIQRIARGFTHRARSRRIAHSKFTRFYDSNLNKFYYMYNDTQQTFWKASKWYFFEAGPFKS